MKAASPGRGRIAVASGWGVVVKVAAGQLVVLEGKQHRGPARRRERRYTKAYVPFDRLIVASNAGEISLAAVRWLADAGAALVHIDNQGRLLAVSAHALGVADQAQLRRAQAVAGLPGSPVGLAISKRLVADRIAGAATVALEQLYDERLAERLEVLLDDVARARTIDQLRLHEATAARMYWDRWERLPVRFEGPNADRAPEPWHCFGARHSPITGRPQTAGNPANALANYLYSLVQAEAHIAALSYGLDPLLGIYHRDREGRNSLAVDAMEPARPVVEAFLLRMLRDVAFQRRDFHERPNGEIRLARSLSAYLAGTGETWRPHVVPVVAWVVSVLADEPAPAHAMTGFRRGRKKRASKAPPLPSRCRRCSALVTIAVPRGRRGLCEGCRPKCRLCKGQIGDGRTVICATCDASRACGHCKASLAGRAHSARFCGPPCRRRYLTTMRRASLPAVRVCSECAVPLDERKRIVARYCSVKCGKRARRRAAREGRNRRTDALQ